MFATWRQMNDTNVIESECHSNLDPLSAREWSLLVKSTQSPICLLGDYLTNFMQLTRESKSLVDVLGDSATYDSEESSISSAFNILTESRIPTISNVVSKRTSKQRSRNVEGPMTDDILLPIINFLFPDATENSVSYLFKRFTVVMLLLI